MPEIPEEAVQAADVIARQITAACPWPDAHGTDDPNPDCDYGPAAKVAREAFKEQP